MSDEPEDYIENINAIRKNWVGEEMEPAEILQEFHLYGPAKRAAALDEFDRSMKNLDTGNLRKISDLITLRGEMRDAQYRLLKAGK